MDLRLPFSFFPEVCLRPVGAWSLFFFDLLENPSTHKRSQTAASSSILMTFPRFMFRKVPLPLSSKPTLLPPSSGAFPPDDLQRSRASLFSLMASFLVVYLHSMNSGAPRRKIFPLSCAILESLSSHCGCLFPFSRMLKVSLIVLSDQEETFLVAKETLSPPIFTPPPPLPMVGN